MYLRQTISAIIPARDESRAISQVVEALAQLHFDTHEPVFDNIIVCDNGSTDDTAEVAARAGAIVVKESRLGYGNACFAALSVLPSSDIVVFIDGDNAFYADQCRPLIDAIVNGADLAIGSRQLGCTEKGALTVVQRFGNRLASVLIQWIWGVPITDLGPYRAIRTDALKRLAMQDRTFGWTVEMQVKAIQANMKLVECAVDTRRRIGKSKISGTIRGSLGAAHGILGMIFLLWRQECRAKRQAVATREQ
ncbi:MAG: glycosyltransferase family 2 protein [Gammaproteobacteria bacterium]|nr:glycosyltransferase family 2 protein [Gammaproteobacteria bacterium]